MYSTVLCSNWPFLHVLEHLQSYESGPKVNVFLDHRTQLVHVTYGDISRYPRIYSPTDCYNSLVNPNIFIGGIILHRRPASSTSTKKPLAKSMRDYPHRGGGGVGTALRRINRI